MTEISGTEVLSVEQLLQRAKDGAAAKAAGKVSANASEVEKLLAGREESDTVNLSAVAKILLARDKQVEDRSKNYEENDEFIEMKARYLSAQIASLSNLASNPAFAATLAAVEDEATKLIQKIADRQTEVTEKAAAEQAKLDALKEDEPEFTVEQLLERAKASSEGRSLSEELSPAAKALLDKVANAVDVEA